MSSIYIAILSMYFFIFVGFMAKWHFKERINTPTLNLLSIYFLQPFLSFWGLLQRPIDWELLSAPLFYLLSVALILFSAFFAVKLLFKNRQEQSIATIAAFIGNTGNLGIPLGMAIFGLESIPYLVLINLMNVIVVYTLGVFFYSRGHFSIKASLLNIVKLPVLWFALLGVLCNVSGVVLYEPVLKALKMGAFASIVVQLLLFGLYLQEAKFEQISKKLIAWVLAMKFVILPFLALLFLMFTPLVAAVKGMIFMELMMPLAVANINLSALYNCKAHTVTVLVFISSALFLLLMFIYIPLIEGLFLS